MYFKITDITPPLVVLNNFGQSEESQVKLMRITFQHMFPTINTKTVKLSDCRRVVLYHYHKDEGTVEMRHYAIRAQPVGVSTAVKRILQSRVPNLGDLEVENMLYDGIFVDRNTLNM
jgi:ribosome biogenesis protein SSF1/2